MSETFIGERREQPSNIQWVDISRFDAEQNVAVLEARCILENGVVRVEGPNTELVRRLETEGIQLGDSMPLKPEHGKGFLFQLSRVYRTPYRQATEIQEGGSLPEWQPPAPEPAEKES